MQREVTHTADADHDRQQWMARLAAALARALIQATESEEPEDAEEHRG